MRYVALCAPRTVCNKYKVDSLRAPLTNPSRCGIRLATCHVTLSFGNGLPAAEEECTQRKRIHVLSPSNKTVRARDQRVLVSDFLCLAHELTKLPR